MLVGKQVFRLKHAAPSKMAFADSPNATMMQALRSIGGKNVGEEGVVEQIARAVPRKTKDDFTRLSPVAPDGTRPIITTENDSNEILTQVIGLTCSGQTGRIHRADFDVWGLAEER
jgi:hypothetical protein